MDSANIRKWLRSLIWCGLLTLGHSPNELAVGADKRCDRACLHVILDQYLEAIFKHNPALAPLAPEVRSTENAAALVNGAGIWRSATGYGTLQRRYFDTSNGTAAYFGLINESAEPAIASVRLKVENRRIREAEWTVARLSAGGMFSIDGLLAQPPPPDIPIPKGQRAPREQMIASADAYFDGLQNHDGSRVPHVVGCDRIENGFKVTNRAMRPPGSGPGGTPGTGIPSIPSVPGAASIPGTAQEVPAGGASAPGLAQEVRSGDCASGFEMFAKTIAEASHRRYPVVDEEAGVVMGTTLFHRPPGVNLKRNLLTEYFFEKQGKISAIYAAMYYLDPSAPDTPGWN
jgi:hypothetical protein